MFRKFLSKLAEYLIGAVLTAVITAGLINVFLIPRHEEKLDKLQRMLEEQRCTYYVWVVEYSQGEKHEYEAFRAFSEENAIKFKDALLQDSVGIMLNGTDSMRVEVYSDCHGE